MESINNSLNLKKVIQLDKYNKETFDNPYNYPLDDFQKNAVTIINSNEPHNILVTAHTGSGKSLVAEHAIRHNFKNKKRTFYTSPIKSLSNQKYYEFKQKFANLTNEVYDADTDTYLVKPITIGLITGDHKCNPQADCIILTTEILLNVINFNNIKKSNDIPLEILSLNNIFDITLDDVQTVVFDEVHYINDLDRGGIWEQSILKLPDTINQILLSATIDMPIQFARWINSCNNLPTYILQNHKRVVPLYFSTFYTLNKSVLNKITNVKTKPTNLTKNILTPEKLKEYANLVNKLIPMKDTIKETITLTEYELVEKLHKHLIATELNTTGMVPIINNTINYLVENCMTPCLFFVLSRNKIHQLIDSCNLTLNDTDEQHTVSNLFDNYVRNLSGSYESIEMMDNVKQMAIKGLAIHHSGMIPILKEIVELLYSKNLIKVLFATETFSVGLNMPTKTVIFTSINKFDGSKFRTLFSHEFIQMGGRAGRRGIDEYGHVIYLPQLERSFTTSLELKNMLIAKPQKLRSKYNIDPIYVLKALYNGYNISDDIKKTMWYIEKTSQKDGIQKEYNELIKIKSNDLVESLDQTTIDLLKEYSLLCNTQFKPKNYKKILEEIENKIENFYKIYQEWTKFVDHNIKLKNLKSNINYFDNIIQESINVCFTFLENNDFIQYNNNSDSYKLTDLGKCAIYLGDDSNPLIFSKIIQHNKFKTLDCKDMIITIAMLCDNNYSDNLIPINLQHIAGIYYELVDINNKMSNELNKLEININSDWNITQNNFNIVENWLNMKSYNEIALNYDIYEGNFIKNMIKLGNMVKSLVVYYKSAGINTEIVNKLNDFDKIINRDIVTCESIYLTI